MFAAAGCSHDPGRKKHALQWRAFCGAQSMRSEQRTNRLRDARRECTEIHPPARGRAPVDELRRGRGLGAKARFFWQIPPTAQSAIGARLLTRVNRELRTPDVRRTSLPRDSFDSRGRVTLRTFRRSYRLLRRNDSYGCRDVGRRGETGSPKPLLHVTLTLTMRATVGSRQSLTSVPRNGSKSAGNILRYARIYVLVLTDVRVIAATTEYPARHSHSVCSIRCELSRSECRGKREKTPTELSYFIVLILLTFRNFVSSLRGVTDISRELIVCFVREGR